MTDTQVTILTAMSTEDVVRILDKIEDKLADITFNSKNDEQINPDKIEFVIDFIQDLRFGIEKGVNSK